MGLHRFSYKEFHTLSKYLRGSTLGKWKIVFSFSLSYHLIASLLFLTEVVYGRSVLRWQRLYGTKTRNKTLTLYTLFGIQINYLLFYIYICLLRRNFLLWYDDMLFNMSLTYKRSVDYKKMVKCYFCFYINLYNLHFTLILKYIYIYTFVCVSLFKYLNTT